MLVLTRKPNETIVIGESITVTVLQARGNTIRLGITAPRNIRVVRGELERHNNSESNGESSSEVQNRESANLVVEYQSVEAEAGEAQILPIAQASEIRNRNFRSIAQLPDRPTDNNRTATTPTASDIVASQGPLQSFIMSARLRLGDSVSVAQ